MKQIHFSCASIVFFSIVAGTSFGNVPAGHEQVLPVSPADSCEHVLAQPQSTRPTASPQIANTPDTPSISYTEQAYAILRKEFATLYQKYNINK
jgi:hypothetical protein